MSYFWQEENDLLMFSSAKRCASSVAFSNCRHAAHISKLKFLSMPENNTEQIFQLGNTYWSIPPRSDWKRAKVIDIFVDGIASRTHQHLLGKR